MRTALSSVTMGMNHAVIALAVIAGSVALLVGPQNAAAQGADDIATMAPRTLAEPEKSPGERMQEAYRAGQFETALEIVDSELNRISASGDRGSSDYLSFVTSKGAILVALERHREAAEILAAELPKVISTFGEDGSSTLSFKTNLAHARYGSGEIDKAAAEMREIIAVFKRTDGETSDGTIASYESLSMFLRRKDPDASLKAQIAATERAFDAWPKDDALYDMMEGLAYRLAANERREEAAQWWSKIIASIREETTIVDGRLTTADPDRPRVNYYLRRLNRQREALGLAKLDTAMDVVEPPRKIFPLNARQIASVPIMHSPPPIEQTAPAREVNLDNPIEAMSAGFESIWEQASETGLKFDLKPVDVSFFDQDVPIAWLTEEVASKGPFRDRRPPALDGVSYSGNWLTDWRDYFSVAMEDIDRTKDRETYVDLVRSNVALEHEAIGQIEREGAAQTEYQDALRRYIAGLTPEVDLSQFKSLQAMMQAKEEDVERLQIDALKTLSSAELEELEQAMLHYLSVRLSQTSDDIDGTPAEGGMAEKLALIVQVRGEATDARLQSAIDSWKFNSAAEDFNGFVNYWYQNDIIGNYSGSTMWSWAMLNKLPDLIERDDPLALRVVILATADHYGAQSLDRAKRLARISRELCEQQECGDILAHEQTIRSLENLRKFGANVQADAFVAALEGSSEEPSAAMAALGELPGLKVELYRCYGKAETQPDNPSKPTEKGQIQLASCDVEIGQKILAAYEAGGTKLATSFDYQWQMLDVAKGAAIVGNFELAEQMFARVLPYLDPHFTEFGSDMRTNYASVLISLGRFDLADKELETARQTLISGYLDGYVTDRDFRNRQKAIEGRTLDRYLNDESQAHLAFPIARKLAEESRVLRQSQVGSVFDETNLARIIGWNGTFKLAIDASWAEQVESKGANPDALVTAFLAAQDALSDPTTLAVSYAMAERAEFADNPEAAQLIQRRRFLLDALAPYEGVNQPFFGQSQADDARGQIAQRRAWKEAEAYSKEYRELNKRLSAISPEYYGLIRPDPLSLSEARSVVGKDEALLLVVPASKGTHVFAVTSDDVVWHRSNWNEAKIDEGVRRIRWFLGNDIEAEVNEIFSWIANVDGGSAGYDRDTAFALYKELLQPLEQHFKGKSHVLYSASGALSSLPLGVLVTAEPEGRDDDPVALRSTAWMADQVALVRLPSLQALAYERKVIRMKKKPTRAANFLGFGDPVLDGQPQRRGVRGEVKTAATRAASGPTRFAARPPEGLADPEALRRMSKLPGTRAELQALESVFGKKRSRLSLGSDATETQFKQSDFDNVSVITLATHALLANQITGVNEPGLVLTPPEQATATDDGFLSASEISALQLSADWVILSACNTASGDGSEGANGLSGLARSFLFAGAKSLLVSHWPVDDEVAASITVRAIELGLEKPSLTKAQAFMRAMQEVRGSEAAEGDALSDASRSWAHPFYWAPFEYVATSIN